MENKIYIKKKWKENRKTRITIILGNTYKFYFKKLNFKNQQKTKKYSQDHESFQG